MIQRVFQRCFFLWKSWWDSKIQLRMILPLLCIFSSLFLWSLIFQLAKSFISTEKPSVIPDHRCTLSVLLFNAFINIFRIWLSVVSRTFLASPPVLIKPKSWFEPWNRFSHNIYPCGWFHIVRGKIHPEMMFQYCHWRFINFLDVSYHTIFSSFKLKLSILDFFVLLSSAAGSLALNMSSGNLKPSFVHKTFEWKSGPSNGVTIQFKMVELVPLWKYWKNLIHCGRSRFGQFVMKNKVWIRRLKLNFGFFYESFVRVIIGDKLFDLEWSQILVFDPEWPFVAIKFSNLWITDFYNQILSLRYEKKYWKHTN